jgi:hypothetical protein
LAGRPRDATETFDDKTFDDKTCDDKTCDDNLRQSSSHVFVNREDYFWRTFSSAVPFVGKAENHVHRHPSDAERER